MKINLEKGSNYAVIKLIGNLVEGPSSGEFSQLIEKLIKEDISNIIIDLEKVSYANSTGLSVLFNGYRKLDKRGGKFKLVNLNDKFKKLLSITKFDTLFEIHDNVGSAIKSITT
jgi:anti-anti-sigma factor